VALTTMVTCSFEGTIKLQSGIQRERLDLEGESVDDLWCEAFERFMFTCEAVEGVLLGIVILSADVSREEVNLIRDQLN